MRDFNMSNSVIKYVYRANLTSICHSDGWKEWQIYFKVTSQSVPFIDSDT